jgi:hypothetical protein
VTVAKDVSFAASEQYVIFGSSVRLEVEQNQLVSGGAYFSLGSFELQGA